MQKIRLWSPPLLFVVFHSRQQVRRGPTSTTREHLKYHWWRSYHWMINTGLWDSLSQDVIMVTHLEGFKKALDKFMENQISVTGRYGYHVLLPMDCSFGLKNSLSLSV